MLGENKEMSKFTLKKNLLITASAATLLTAFTNVPTASAKVQGPDINAEASITVDYETGQILQGNRIDEPLGIASMTKMVVEYIVFEELEAGNINWDTEIIISDYAYQVSQDYALSNVPLRNGEKYTLRELYEAMAIYSANGATIAIAEAIAGSEPAFVDRMQKTVESFGIKDAFLVNSTGLNNSDLKGNIYTGTAEDAENTMSARSVAKITNRIVRDYPEILETASIPKLTFREGTSDAINMVNWNMMLEGLLFERKGVDGLKTGTTNFAGSTFTGTAKEGDRRVITVVMKAGDDKTTRFVETNKMMDFGFNNFSSEVVTDGWAEKVEYKPLAVADGKEDVVNYEPSEALEMLIQLGDNVEEDVTYTIEWDSNVVKEDGTVEAPISKGTEVGRLVANYSGNELGYLEEDKVSSVPLVTTEAVDKIGIFGQIWAGIIGFFEGIISRF